jgi:hypothetical protein
MFAQPRLTATLNSHGPTAGIAVSRSPTSGKVAPVGFLLLLLAAPISRAAASCSRRVRHPSSCSSGTARRRLGEDPGASRPSAALGDTDGRFIWLVPLASRGLVAT